MTEPKNPALVIEQDYELDFDGEVGSPLAVFWTADHGHDPTALIRAIVEHCLDCGRDIPRIPDDARPVEMWQQNIPRGDAVEYHRHAEKPPGVPHRHLHPVTVLDVDRRQSGAPICSVQGCHRPWHIGHTITAVVDLTEGDHEAVSMRMCREHSARFPAPSYRVRMVPVGATIVLASPTDGTGEADEAAER